MEKPMTGISIKPVIRQSDNTIGVFTPSMPAHILLKEKYQLGLGNLEKIGFRVKEGYLTQKGVIEKYRTASAQERAEEFMSLIRDSEVDILMANIGGLNSSSMLPYLDYEEIREARKLIVGYSDVTNLHMAILARSGLRSCYGPAVTPSFGEWPSPDATAVYFKSLIAGQASGAVEQPACWSNTFRDYFDGSWRQGQRIYVPNDGWHGLQPGDVQGPVIAANLSSLLSIAGTPYFPDLRGKILLLEEMDVSVGMLERRINQLKIMGVLENLKGLIFSKIEFPEANSCYADYERVLLEFCGEYDFPIVSNFDCGHTTPMLNFCQDTEIRLISSSTCSVTVLEEPILRKKS